MNTHNNNKKCNFFKPWYLMYWMPNSNSALVSTMKSFEQSRTKFSTLMSFQWPTFANSTKTRFQKARWTTWATSSVWCIRHTTCRLRRWPEQSLVCHIPNKAGPNDPQRNFSRRTTLCHVRNPLHSSKHQLPSTKKKHLEKS